LESSKIVDGFGRIRSLHVHGMFQRSETIHSFAGYAILSKVENAGGFLWHHEPHSSID